MRNLLVQRAFEHPEMAMQACPDCGTKVRVENVAVHYAKVHPGKEPPDALLQEAKRVREEAGRAARTRRPRRRPSMTLVVLALILIVAGGVGAAYVLRGGSLSSGDVVTYCGGEGTARHYHPLLVINVNGVQKNITADIGITMEPGYTNPNLYCPPGQVHALHTHDGSGIIHAELPASITATPTLGNFFTIWGPPLLPTQVWTFSGTVRATMYNSDTHAGTDYSGNPAAMPLYYPSGDPNAYPIPPGLIFNGAYGSGASNGMFSGQIIWLNVTR